MMIPNTTSLSSRRHNTCTFSTTISTLLLVISTVSSSSSSSSLSSSSSSFAFAPPRSCQNHRLSSFIVIPTAASAATTTTTYRRPLLHLNSSSSNNNNNNSNKSPTNDPNKNDDIATTSSSRTATDSQSNNINEEEEEQQEQERTSFDQAGASLIEEEDRKRMEEMGDFDLNPAYKDDSIEQMRAAIRERTAAMGLEKSKVSADYIKSKQAAAMAAGGAQAAREQQQGGGDMFGGLDLSKITSDGKSRGEWDESMPTMFYEPEAEMSMEEQQQVDPLMTKNPIEQALIELQNAKWPTLASAGREVVLMAAVVAFSAVLIIGADKLLRALYTNVGFIPSAEDLANYAARFDGLDLPTGWTDNMNENDVAEFADKVSSVVTPPTTSSSSGSGLPGL